MLQYNKIISLHAPTRLEGQLGSAIVRQPLDLQQPTDPQSLKLVAQSPNRLPTLMGLLY